MMAASAFAMSALGIALLVLLVAAVLVAGVVFGIRFIHSRNQQLKTMTNASAQRERALREAAAQCDDDELRRKIEQLADEVHFSDWALVLPADGELGVNIFALSQAVNYAEKERIKACAQDVEMALEQRKAAIAEMRRGSF